MVSSQYAYYYRKHPNIMIRHTIRRQFNVRYRKLTETVRLVRHESSAGCSIRNQF